MKKRIRRNFTLITAWLLACSLVGCQTETSSAAEDVQLDLSGKNGNPNQPIVLISHEQE